MDGLRCSKCGNELDCLAGHSAHPANWYCSRCETGKNSTDAMEGTARKVWGLPVNEELQKRLSTAKPGEKIPVTKEEMEELNKSTFSNRGAYELPEHTIEAFLASDAGPEAVISFTKKELEDYISLIWNRQHLVPCLPKIDNDYQSFLRWKRDRDNPKVIYDPSNLINPEDLAKHGRVTIKHKHIKEAIKNLSECSIDQFMTGEFENGYQMEIKPDDTMIVSRKALREWRNKIDKESYWNGYKIGQMNPELI